MQPFYIYSYIHFDDFMATWTCFGEYLSCEKRGSISRNFPAILQEHALKVMHFLTYTFTGAEILEIKEQWQSTSLPKNSCGYLKKIHYLVGIPTKWVLPKVLSQQPSSYI